LSDSPTLADDLATITQQRADVGQFFNASFATSKTTGLALLAADPGSVVSGFTTNASVFRSDLGLATRAPDLDALTQGKLAALNRDSTITGTIDRRHVLLGGKDATQLAYVFNSRGKSVEVTSYLLAVDVGQDRLEYELTIGSATADYAQLFDKIAASFALSPAKAPPTAASPANSINPAGPGPPTPPP
jgi:hypothetical protein